MKKYLPFVIIAAVLVAALGGAALMMKKPSDSAPAPAPTQAVQRPGELSQPNAGRPAQSATPPPPPATPTPSAPPAYFRGPATAPVVIEEFSDFQCPTCAYLHTVLKQLLARYPSQVRLAFRHYPLQTIHRHAREAARAAEAAGRQGKFWEMHDVLYEKQAEWSKADPARPLFVQYAKSIGLDTDRFLREIDSTTVSLRVVEDERHAISLGLTGTPTFFINGRLLAFEQSNDLGKLSAQVNRALAEVK